VLSEHGPTVLSMSEPTPSEPPRADRPGSEPTLSPKQLAQAKLRARAARIGRMRKRVIAASLATFVLAFGAIAVDGPMGATSSATSQTSASVASGNSTSSSENQTNSSENQTNSSENQTNSSDDQTTSSDDSSSSDSGSSSSSNSGSSSSSNGSGSSSPSTVTTSQS